MKKKIFALCLTTFACAGVSNALPVQGLFSATDAGDGVGAHINCASSSLHCGNVSVNTQFKTIEFEAADGSRWFWFYSSPSTNIEEIEKAEIEKLQSEGVIAQPSESE